MPSVLVPDPAGSLAAHHACSDRGLRRAARAEERAAVRRGDARHDVAADALRREGVRRPVDRASEVDAEAAPRVARGPLVAEPEVPVRDVRDAPPASADGAEDAP